MSTNKFVIPHEANGSLEGREEWGLGIKVRKPNGEKKKD
jgi:hypothetical protein